LFWPAALWPVSVWLCRWRAAVELSTSKLERSTGLPVLGAISQTLTAEGAATKARRTRNFYAASVALGGVFALLLAMEFIQRGTIA
jgi:hypothetical protein